MADTFRNRFIEAMRAKGLRQVDVVKRSGLDKAQISQYKTGKNEPMQDALYKLATALEVNVAWLMGHDVPMEVTKASLEQKVAACELFEKCYGKEAFQAVTLFLQLDTLDQGRVIGSMEEMLKADKYTIKKDLSNRKAI